MLRETQTGSHATSALGPQVRSAEGDLKGFIWGLGVKGFNLYLKACKF